MTTTSFTQQEELCSSVPKTTGFSVDETVKIIGCGDSTCPVKKSMIGQVYQIGIVTQLGNAEVFGIQNRENGETYYFYRGELTK